MTRDEKQNTNQKETSLSFPICEKVQELLLRRT